MPDNNFLVSVGFIPDAASLNKLEGSIAHSVSNGLNKGNKGLIQGINEKAYTQPLGRITGKANEFEKSFAAANARVIAFGASAAPIFLMGEAFRKLVDSTIQVEKSMTGINAIFGLTGGSLRRFTSDLFNVANKTGQSWEMATEAATEFARQGLNTEETLKRTSAALILNKISGLDMGEAVSSITSILNGFSKEALDTTTIIQKMTAVDTQFAISAGDLAEALKRVGASANDANVSFDQTISLITAARQITGREGAVIGNSLKTIFTRLERPKVLDDLEEVGIKVRDLNGTLLTPIEILKNMANSYDGLAQSQKSFITETVGGVYQVNILKGALRDLSSGASIYDNALKATENSTNAITKRMDVLNSTLASGIVRTMNDLTLAASNVGQSFLGSSMKNGISSFDNLTKNVADKTNPDNKGVTAQALQGGLKGLGNLIAGPGVQVAITLIFKLLQRLSSFALDSGKDILGLDSGMKERIALEKAWGNVLNQNKGIIDDIIAGKVTLNELTEKTLQASKVEIQSQNFKNVIIQKLATNSVGKGMVNTQEIPNLYNPISDALERENQATGGYAKLSYSPLLITSSNPYGLAAIDSRNQKNATDAFQQHRSLGQTVNQIQSAGFGTRKISKSIPNLATNNLDTSFMLSTFGYAAQMGNTAPVIQKFINLFPELFSLEQREIYSKRRIVKEFDEMAKNLATTNKPQNFNGKTFDTIEELQTSTITTGVDKYRMEVDDFFKKQNEQKQNLFSTGFKVSAGSSMAGGFLSQVASNSSPSLGAAVEDFSSGITSAGQALIAFPNKIGKSLFGGLVLTGIFNSIDTFSKGLENAEKQAELEQNRFKQLSDTLQSLSQTSSELNTLYLDAGTSQETIVRESKKYADILAQLTQIQGGAEIARKVMAAPDENSRLSAINDFKAKQTQIADTSAAIINTKELFDKSSFLGFNHLPGLQKDQGFTYSNDFDKDSVQQQLVENAGVAIENMSESFKDSLTDSITSLNDFKNVLNNFGGQDANNVREFLNQLKKESSPEAYNQIIQEIRALLTQNFINKNPAVANSIKNAREQATGAQLNINAATKNEEYIRRLFINQGSLTANNLLDIRGVVANKRFGEESTRLSGLDTQSGLFSETNGARTVARRQYGINLQTLGLNTNKEINNLNIESNKSLIDGLTQDAEKLFKQTDLTQTLAGQKNLDVAPYTASLVEGINKGLTKTLQSNSNSDLIDKFSKNGQFNFQSFASQVAGNSGLNSSLQGQVEKYINSQQSIDILKTLNQTNNKQVDILQDFKNKSIEEAQKLNAALAEADFKKLVGYMGGVQNLLDRGSMRSLMREEQRGINLMHSNSPQSQAMGATMVLESLKKQGVTISDDNHLVKEAHDIFLSAGAKTYSKYSSQLINNVSNTQGAGSEDVMGLKQIYGEDLTKVLKTQYAAEFKPEGGNDTSGAFVDSTSYLKPFNDELVTATNTLKSFPDSILKTIKDLNEAISAVQNAKEINGTVIKEASQQIEKAQINVLNSLGEAGAESQATKQNNDVGWLSKAGPIITSVGTYVVGSLLSNAGGKLMGSLYKTFTSKLGTEGGVSTTKEVIESIENKIEETTRHGTADFVKATEKNTQSTSSNIKENFAKQTKVENFNTQPINTGAVRLPKPPQGDSADFPNSIVSHFESNLTGQAPKILPKPITSTNLRVGGKFMSIDKYINNLKEQYQNKLTEVAQKITLGQSPDLKSIGMEEEITGLNNWKGLGKETILKRLSEMGYSAESHISPIEKVLKENYSSKIAENSGILNLRRDRYNNARASSVSNAMFEKSRGPSAILRQTTLREGIEKKQSLLRERVNLQKLNGESSIPYNLLKEGFDYKPSLSKNTLTGGILRAQESNSLDAEDNFIGNVKNLGKHGLALAKQSLLKRNNWIPNWKPEGLKTMHNPFSNLSQFKNASALGKFGRALPFVGAAASLAEFGSDLKNSDGYSAGGHLALNALSFAGPVGLVGNLAARKIESYGRQGIDAYSQNENEESRGQNLDTQLRLLPRILAQNKKRKSILESNFSANKTNQQNAFMDSIENDPTNANGRARTVLSPLLGGLQGMREGKGLSDLTAKQRNTLQGVYNVLYPSDKGYTKKEEDYKGFKSDGHETGFGADFGRYVTSHSQEVQQKLQNYYGSKGMPILLDGGYGTSNYDTSKNRVLSNSGISSSNVQLQNFQNSPDGTIKDIIEAIKQLGQQNIEKDKADTITQDVNFSQLPINITISSLGTADLSESDKTKIQQIIDTLKDQLQTLKDRMTKLDGQASPTPVNQ